MSDDPYIIVGTNTSRRLVKPSNRRWLLPVCGGAILLGVIIVIVASLLTSPSLPTIPVQKGDIVWSYIASGRVETESTIEIVPKVSALIESIHVKEGDSVQKGVVLVQLRDETLAARYQEAIRSREAAQARWDDVKIGTRQELIDHGAAQLKEAQAEVRRRAAIRDETWK